MILPLPIQRYFTADAARDAAALSAAFAPDAAVQDEGETHQGAAQILAWWHAAKRKYNHRAEPIDLTQTAETAVVRARVSGDFPGSPAVLRFAFELAGDRIRSLTIG